MLSEGFLLLRAVCKDVYAIILSMVIARSGQISFFDVPNVPKIENPSQSIDDSFPEEEANALAALEAFNKHLYRPNTYLHKWWARRSGSTFRHILKQLSKDLKKRDYYSSGGLEGITILDPMMGGGTTIHEAIRLGANCIGFDIDPIPVLQARASLQQQPLSERSELFNKFISSLRDSIRPQYDTYCPVCVSTSEIQFTLYGLRRRCNCKEVVILDSYTLRRDSGESVHICPNCMSVYKGLTHDCEGVTTGINLLERLNTTCVDCHSKYKDLLDVSYYQRYYPVAIIGQCSKHGQFYKTLNTHDWLTIRRLEDERNAQQYFQNSDFIIPAGPKTDDLINRNIRNYLDLFSSRQLSYIKHALDLLHDIKDENRIWLGLLLSTSLEFNCLLAGYKGADLRRPGAIRHVFSHHAYSFPYTALENNPVCHASTSGTLERLFKDRIIKASKWATSPVERAIEGGKLKQVPIKGETDLAMLVDSANDLKKDNHRAYLKQVDSSLTSLSAKSVDYIVTDPPYFESVQYSNLSSFFRVWLRKLLPQDADWDYDPRASAVAEDMNGGSSYGDVLSRIWSNFKPALKAPHGRLIFTFHHWRPQAWSELTLSLMRSGFELVNFYVVFSENPISVHINKLNSLKHDCILVLRPRDFGQASNQWLLPATLVSKDSREFCINCGNILGNLLCSGKSESEIRSIWQKIAEEK